MPRLLAKKTRSSIINKLPLSLQVAFIISRLFLVLKLMAFILAESIYYMEGPSLTYNIYTSASPSFDIDPFAIPGSEAKKLSNLKSFRFPKRFKPCSPEKKQAFLETVARVNNELFFEVKEKLDPRVNKLLEPLESIKDEEEIGVNWFHVSTDVGDVVMAGVGAVSIYVIGVGGP
jgi:hypothetical protein